MKRVGHLWDIMISDDNIKKAILIVNLSHRWQFGHKPNKTVVWVEVTVEERVKELREIIENIVRAYQRKTLVAWEIAKARMLKEVMA